MTALRTLFPTFCLAAAFCISATARADAALEPQAPKRLTLDVDCKPVGFSHFSGLVSIVSMNEKKIEAEVDITLSAVNRGPNGGALPVVIPFKGSMNGAFSTIPAGQLAKNEVTFIQLRRPAGEKPAGLQILSELPAKNAKFIYDGVIYEALCQ